MAFTNFVVVYHACKAFVYLQMYENYSLESDYASTLNSNQSILTSDGDDSLTSSVFGFVCAICSVRAIKQMELIYQYHNDEVFLTGLDNDIHEYLNL